MINVKTAVGRARRAFPNFMLISCVELDNGAIFFGKDEGGEDNIAGTVGLFVSSTTPDVAFVSMGFYAEHDAYDEKELDISRFQTPKERQEASK